MVEAILFTAPEPTSSRQIAEALNVSIRQVEESLKQLDTLYESRGIRLQRHNKAIQLTSAPEAADSIAKYLSLEETTRLSKAALETLAIIAYRQPITRPTIDSIRGVSSDGVLRSLLAKGLIIDVGREEGPGRPILYATTSEFLQHFGLSSLDELPPFIEEPEEDETHIEPEGPV